MTSTDFDGKAEPPPTASSSYPIVVTVYDNLNVPKSGVSVNCYNESTGETISAKAVTDINGKCWIDPDDFPSGYTDKVDYFQITASGSGTAGKELKFKAVNYGNYAQINKMDIEYET